MVDLTAHPLIQDEPGGRCWRRGERRHYGRAAEAHRELVVLLGLSDRAQYLIDGTVVPLRRGTLLFALAGQSHVLLSDTSGFDMWVFLISGRILTEDRRQDPEFPPLHVDDRGAVDARRVSEAGVIALDAAAQFARHAAPGPARDALRYWLTLAWSHWAAADAAALSRVPPAVDRAAHVLRRAPELSLSDVADQSGLSAGRLSKLFAAQTGQGFAEFRTECRLARVEDLLRDGRARSLTEAALEAGYGSYSQFFRDYTRRIGQSPRELLRE